MEKWNDKYRIPSARAEWWDYTNDGAYFITICTKNRAHFFGECRDGKMILSTAGAIAQGFWYDIPNHFPFVQLGAFVVMPNHIHGILILDKSNSPDMVETLQCNVSTPPPTDKNEFYANISPAAGSVSTIVRSYKSVCTKHIHKALPAINFGWQERFWDNIIKDEAGFHRIAAYIVHNPQNWQEDKFYLNNTIK